MQKLITYSLFVFFFLTGVLIFKDYGISTDEDFQRLVGFYWLNYIANFFPGSNFLLDWLPTSNEDIISFDALTYSGNIAYLNFFY